MLPYSDSKWTRIALGIFFLIIIAYAYYEVHGLLFGPQISISAEKTTSNEQFVMIQGNADRIVSLAMNGKEITVTENGDFSEPYLLADGDNRIVFDAKDKYGHITSRTVEVVYVPGIESISPATTTETQSTTTLN